MSTHPGEQLSALLDGDLDAADAASVRTHVADCAACRAMLADLEALRQQARAWAEVEVAPAHDLWPALAARLDSPAHDTGSQAGGDGSRVVSGPARWYQRRWSLGLPELALAASLAAAVGGALVWSRPAAAPEPPEAVAAAPIVADAEPMAVDTSAVTPVSFADAQYDAAVVDLEHVLQEQRQRLDPRTVIVLERNLRIIDEAIREAREALAADPANAMLNAHLASARRRKLDLLRRATTITEGN